MSCNAPSEFVNKVVRFFKRLPPRFLATSDAPSAGLATPPCLGPRVFAWASQTEFHSVDVACTKS